MNAKKLNKRLSSSLEGNRFIKIGFISAIIDYALCIANYELL